jgi:hypothetical protein
MMYSLASDYTGASYISYENTSTYNLDNANATDTLYWRFRDDYNNITSGSTTLPERPPFYMVQDTTNMYVDPHVYALFTGWAEVSVPASGSFLQYNILRATANEDSQFSKVGDTVEYAKELNYYNDSPVAFDTDLYYKVTAEDTNHNISFRSTSSWGKANGTQDAGEGGGGTETTAPVITNIQVSNVTSTGAIITWDTDELSKSRTDYYITPDENATAFDSHTKSVASMLDNAAGAGQHRIMLTSLTPNKQYIFRVMSTDSAGNIATRDKDDSENDLTFTTSSGPIITNVQASPVRNTQATITWTTSEAANTYITYSENPDMSAAFPETGNDSLTANHSFTINGLTSGTTYYYYVRSGNTVDNNEGNYYNFTTTNDNSLPSITFDPMTGITNVTDTRASIIWATNKATTGKVSYDTTQNAYGSFQESTSLNYDHRIDLTNLSPSTTYYFKLESTDENNNTATDDNSTNDYTFTTEATADTTGPVITDVLVTDTNPDFAVITWTTNELSSSFIQYATTTTDFTNNYKESGKNDDSTITHAVTIEGLTQNTDYYYRIRSVDGNGNESVNDNNGSYYTFTSAQGPTITNINVNPDLTSATITWTTDTNSNAYVIYSENSDLSDPQEKGYSARTGTSQSVTIEGLVPGATYYYALRSTNAQSGVTTDDNSGNYYSFNATTDTTDPAIGNIQVESITSSSAIVRWTTDEPATTQVEYGTAQGSLTSSTTLNSNLNIDHIAILSGLEPDTTYYFKVISSDANNNESEDASANNHFDTLQGAEFQHAPLSSISDPAVSPITDEDAVISFDTDQSARCTIAYGTETGSYTETNSTETEYNKNHSIHIEGLNVLTQYFYRITCVDNLPTTLDSSERSFNTLARQVGHTPLSTATHDTDPSVTMETDSEAFVTFSAGTEASSKLCYSASANINMDTCSGVSPQITNSKIHSYHLTGLTPNTTYYVKMRLTDSVNSADTYTTGEVSFNTLEVQASHIPLGSATHDTTVTVTMKTDTEAAITFNAGTTASSKFCYAKTADIDMDNCSGVSPQITNSKIHSYHLSNLDSNSRYYLKMRLTDSENPGDTYTTDESYFSTDENPQFQHDPLSAITDVTNSLITDENAVVTLSTDQSALCFAEASTSQGSYTNPLISQEDGYSQGNYTKQHSIKFTGLIFSTNYYYRITCEDNLGTI